MTVMMIDVPEGRTVQIIVGDVPSTPPAPAVPLVEAEPAPVRRRRPLLLAFGGLCVLGVGFVVGHQTSPSYAEAGPSVASATVPGSMPLPTYSGSDEAAAVAPPPPEPGAAPSPANTSADGGVPSAFTAQLHAPPQVTPAPGAPASGSPPAKNPFGLGG